MSAPPRIIINPWDDELETANSQSQKNIDKWSILVVAWIITIISPFIWLIIYYYIESEYNKSLVLLLGTFWTFSLGLGVFGATLMNMGIA